MIATKGVYPIGIPANDVERAVKFYTEILGMTIAKLNRDDMGDHLNRADLRCGDSMVVLFQKPVPLAKDALKEDGATHQAFTVSPEDFELAAEKMQDWGVQVHSIPTVERATGRGFYFFDPDGNLLQLYAPPKR
jgi:catechol 2,3-dioxygenase-like lactoylglutathione lyase family enzyme